MRRFYTKWIIAAALALPLQAYAESAYSVPKQAAVCKQAAVYVAGLAWHAEGDSYRVFTPGIAGECNGWSAGAYLNSIGRLSLHVDTRVKIYGPIGLRAGLVSGYIEGRVLPSVAASIMVRNVEVLVLPEVRYDVYYTPWTVAARFKFDLL